MLSIHNLKCSGLIEVLIKIFNLRSLTFLKLKFNNLRCCVLINNKLVFIISFNSFLQHTRFSLIPLAL